MAKINRKENTSVASGPVLLERYRADISTRLSSRMATWIDAPIELDLAAVPVKVREAHAYYRTAANVDGSLSFARALKDYSGQLVAILGEPGAGKTTMLQQQAVVDLDSRSYVPIFVELANYTPLTNVTELVLAELKASGISEDVARAHLREGGFRILLDGLNEYDQAEFPDAKPELIQKRLAKEIVGLHRAFRPGNEFVVTCRTAEWPAAIDSRCQKLELLSVGRDDAIEYIASVLTIDKAIARTIFNRFHWGIQQLAHTPLLLYMLGSVLRELQPASSPTTFWASTAWNDELPRTRSALYRRFTRDMLARDLELGRTTIPVRLHEDAIMHIARDLSNRALVIDAADAERILEAFYSGADVLQRHHVTLHELAKDVLGSPPLIPAKGLIGRHSRLSFMHQSFQEHYTALDVRERLKEDALSPLSIAEITAYADDRRWWETLILVAGLLDRPDDLVRSLIGAGQLHLAARCVHESEHVSADVVDQVILAGYERFKYGGDFDYDVIQLLVDIFERSTASLPPRLKDEIQWWLIAYTRGNPRELYHLTDRQLLRCLDSTDSAMVVDAVYTCAQRPVGPACARLIELLSTSPEAIVREQIVIALGKMRCQGAVDDLRRIATSTAEAPPIRALALASLSEFGESENVQVLADYLLNGANPLREAAAWGLSHMEDAAAIPALLDSLDVKDEAGKFGSGQYALGTALYALAQIGDRSVVSRLIQWGSSVDLPFVLEDLAYALGRLGDDSAIPTLQLLLSSKDAVVRRRAVQAVAALGASGRHILAGALTDPSLFVRDAAVGALGSVEESPEATIAARAADSGSPGSDCSGLCTCGEWPDAKLKRRLMDVVQSIVEGRGKNNSQIAAAMFLSDSTLRNYISAINHKLGTMGTRDIADYGRHIGVAPRKVESPRD